MLINDKGDITIIDFGLANILENDMQTSTLICGTLDYMSPEIIQYGISKTPFHEKDNDVWYIWIELNDIRALGVTLYYMLFKEEPFTVNLSSGEMIPGPKLWYTNKYPLKLL